MPFCPISAAKIASLKATVLLLLVLLFKSKMLRLKMSLLGSVLGFAMLIGFLITTGVLTVVAGGAVAYAAMQSGNRSRTPHAKTRTSCRHRTGDARNPWHCWGRDSLEFSGPHARSQQHNHLTGPDCDQLWCCFVRCRTNRLIST